MPAGTRARMTVVGDRNAVRASIRRGPSAESPHDIGAARSDKARRRLRRRCAQRRCLSARNAASAPGHGRRQRLRRTRDRRRSSDASRLPSCTPH